MLGLTKIEKVARSLCVAVGEPETEWPEWVVSAEAAIRALDEKDADGPMVGAGSLDASSPGKSTAPAEMDGQAAMIGVTAMNEEQNAAVELAKSMLADAEQFRFSSAPIPLGPLRLLIAIADQTA